MRVPLLIGSRCTHEDHNFRPMWLISRGPSSRGIHASYQEFPKHSCSGAHARPAARKRPSLVLAFGQAGRHIGWEVARFRVQSGLHWRSARMRPEAATSEHALCRLHRSSQNLREEWP